MTITTPQNQSTLEIVFKFIEEHLQLLDIQLSKLLQAEKKDANNPVQGLFISEQEVLQLLTSPQEKPLLNAFQVEEDRAIVKIQTYIEQNTTIPLYKLINTFHLSLFEWQVLILALAPEIDKKYKKIYAYLQDDMNKTTPTVRLALELFAENPLQSPENWHYFAPNAPLLRFDLIHFAKNDVNSLVERTFFIDERIQRFIFKDSSLDADIATIAELKKPSDIYSCGINKHVTEKIKSVLWQPGEIFLEKHVFWLYGSSTEDAKNLLLSICKDSNLELLTIDIQEILSQEDVNLVAKRLIRETVLQSTLLLITSGEKLLANEGKAQLLKTALLAQISKFPGITCINAQDTWVPEQKSGEFFWHIAKIDIPNYKQRKQLWHEGLEKDLTILEIEDIANNFHFNEQLIRNVVKHAKKISNKITLKQVQSICQAYATPKLTGYARQIPHHYNWDDIVLPPDKKLHLQEIFYCIKNKYQIFSEWGFSKKLALGRGINVLFSGESGTGKTMAANIIASALNMNIYKIDVSTIVDKYIGETEKNLSHIFEEVSSGGAILFFDEADSLFGKRSQVESSHDRYANITVNFILQKIEEHEGVVILATNLIGNMDDAFARRMHITMEFPFLDTTYREKVWQKIFPKETPLENIDYAFLAQKLKSSAGHIKNIALMSAFYAAKDKSSIQMIHIVRAIKREYQKMHKPFIKSDFLPHSKSLES